MGWDVLYPSWRILIINKYSSLLSSAVDTVEFLSPNKLGSALGYTAVISRQTQLDTVKTL
jgi:hypothetical protein